MIRRRTIFGTEVVYPLSRISRSWYSPDGRQHIAAEQKRRREKLVNMGDDSPEYAKMITLTFGTVGDSWAASNSLRGFLTALRTHCYRRSIKPSYIWIAEPQKRMALHYHVVLVNCPFIDKRLIHEWWGRGRTKIEACNRRKTASYIAKYINKQIGQNGQDAVIRHILHSASHQRHLGSSRDISKQPEHWPAWVREYAALNGGLECVLDWFVDRLADVCGLKNALGEWSTWKHSEVSYRIVPTSSISGMLSNATG